MYMCENLLLAPEEIQTIIFEQEEKSNKFVSDNISIILPNQPLYPEHATNKQYVDDVIQNVKWDKAVLKFHDPKLRLPISPKTSDRYISSGTGNGWTINHIYEYNGTDWSDTNPNKGAMIWAQMEKETTFVFNGLTWERLGKSIDHIDLKNKGKYTHQNIDEHINNEKIHNKEKHMNHDNIQNVGVYTHKNIDEHIMNTSTAHFGQNLTVFGNPTFNSLRINETTMATHAVSKNYADMIALGLKWIKHVKKFYDPCSGLPIEYVNGDRYISLTTANKWKQHFIYEYDEKQHDVANKWKEYKPMEGTATYIEEGVIFAHDNIVFNGCEWIKFGSTHNHDSLFGTGSCSHEQLDGHLFNNTDAHFGQLLSQDGSPSFSNLNVLSKIKTNDINTRCAQTNFLQIGVEKLSQSIRDTSQFIMTGNNDPLNIVRIYADASSTEPIKDIYMRARGDLNCPMELLKDTSIGANVYVGHDGTSFNTVGTFECITTEDHRTSAHGSAFVFGTTENGTIEPKVNMILDHDGTMQCKCANDSTSLNSGAVIINGGIAVNKGVNIGGITHLHNDIYFNSYDKISSILNDTLERFDHSIISMCGGGGSSNIRGSKITVSGADSIMNGKIQLNAGIPNGSIEMWTGNFERLNISKNGNIAILNDDDTDCDSNACMTLNGGINIGKNVFIGGNQIIMNKINDASIHPNTNLLQDTSAISLCGGGELDPERGGYVKVSGSNRKKDGGSVLISSGSIYGAKIQFATGADSNISLTSNNAGNWQFNNKTSSTSPSTGAVVIDGGLGVDTVSVNNMRCSKMMQLPCYDKDPPDGELGMMYYDTKNNLVRIFTNMGWRMMMFR